MDREEHAWKALEGARKAREVENLDEAMMQMMYAKFYLSLSREG